MAGKKAEPKSNCMQCGKPIVGHRKPSGHWYRPAQYCSRQCANMALIKLDRSASRGNCAVCEKPLLGHEMIGPDGKSMGWFWPDKYCSRQCQAKGRRRKLDNKRCEICGNRLEPREVFRSSGIRHSTFQASRFCSIECAGVAKRVPETQPIARQIDRHGYVTLKFRKGTTVYQIAEHRWVMEQELKRKLSSHETVHHKNGVRHDNCPENLELWKGRHGRGQRASDLPLFDAGTLLGLMSLSH